MLSLKEKCWCGWCVDGGMICMKSLMRGKKNMPIGETQCALVKVRGVGGPSAHGCRSRGPVATSPPGQTLVSLESSVRHLLTFREQNGLDGGTAVFWNSCHGDGTHRSRRLGAREAAEQHHSDGHRQARESENR